MSDSTSPNEITIQKLRRMIGSNIGMEQQYRVNSIDGNQITYVTLSRSIINTTTLDKFLKLTISAINNSNAWKYLPIGEVYSIFPDRNEEEDDESYKERVDQYCLELNEFMETKGLLKELPKPKGGRKTYHKRNNKKKKRTYKRRK